MNRNRFNFTQPYWEFALPLLSWIFLLPLLVSSSGQSDIEASSSGFMNELIPYFSTNVGLYILASVSVMLLSWSIGSAVSNHELLRKRDFLPAGFAALFGSLGVLLFGYSLSYLAVFFYIMAINSLMHVKRESKSFGQIFNTGFLLTAGALMDARLWLAFPFIFFSLLSLRKLAIRDLFILVVGVVNVLSLALGVYFVYGGVLPNWEFLCSSGEYSPESYSVILIHIARAASGLILLVGVLATERYIAVLSNRAKYRFRILTYVTLLIGMLSYVWSYYSDQHLEFSFFIAPASMAATIYAASIKNRPLRVLFQLCLLALIGVLVMLFFK
ncbi:MAG: hypothetical protein AB8B53_14020 [Flavobacteriales bacterium]